MPNNSNTSTTPKVPFAGKLVVGGLAGILGTSCVFPLDYSKTKLQNQKIGPNGERMYKGVLDCFKKTIRKEGLRGMYNGLPANLIGVTPEKAIKLAANDYFREKLSNADGSISLKAEIIAGGAAGFSQVSATNPMEIVKIRMQLQTELPKEKRMSTLGVVRHLGIRGLYRGSLATWMRDVPYSVLFFPLYAHLKRSTANKETGVNNIASLLFAGGTSGAVASAAVTPADVIKTRLQVKGAEYKTIPSAVSGILKNEGVSAFFKGVIPRASVQAPLFAIALVAFELQQRWWIKYQSEKQNS